MPARAGLARARSCASDMHVSPTSRRPGRPEPGERREAGEREQRLVRRDVGRRLLAPDVLLARLERQDEGSPAVDVDGLAHDASRHAPDEVVACREKAVVRAAVRRPVPGRLALADRDGHSRTPRCFEHAERHRGRHGRSRARPPRSPPRQVGSLLEAAQEVRLLKDHGRSVLRRLGELVRVRDAAPVRHLHDVEPESRGVRLHDLPDLRIERLREHDLRPVRDVACHEARIRGDGRAVVSGRVRDVHARELADDRLVLEDRLEDALAHLGLIRRVRREELAPREHDIRDRRDVVVVDPRAEERELGAGVNVPRRELLDVAHELRLAERRGQIELAAEAHARAGSARRARRREATPIAASISSRSASVSARYPTTSSLLGYVRAGTPQRP